MNTTANKVNTGVNTPATMNANGTTENMLTLSPCAYIFHWSNSTYTYGNTEYRARKGAINNALKAIHDNPENQKALISKNLTFRHTDIYFRQYRNITPAISSNYFGAKA